MPQLPNELYATIVSYIQHKDVLFTLLTTSRFLSNEAERQLYRSLRLVYNTQAVPGIVAITQELNHGELQAPFSVFGRLATEDRIALFVRSIDFTLPAGDVWEPNMMTSTNGSESMIELDMIYAAFHRMKNIRRLTMYASPGTCHSFRRFNYATRIHPSRIQVATMASEPFKQMLLTRMRRFYPRWSTVASAIFPELHHMCEMRVPLFFAKFAPRNHKLSICLLPLTLGIEEEMGSDEPPFRNVVALDLSTEIGSLKVRIPLTRNDLTIAFAISQFPYLQHLTILWQATGSTITTSNRQPILIHEWRETCQILARELFSRLPSLVEINVAFCDHEHATVEVITIQAQSISTLTVP